MPAETLLLLAGTTDAKVIAARIVATMPADRLIVSLAGRTRDPAMPAGALRIGGFGGAEGLAAFLAAEGVTRLVDATHPFAAGMSRNAVEAAKAAGVPRLAYVRPPWTPQAGDRWTVVPCLGAARDALPFEARPFLALGRQHLSPFRVRTDLAPLLRTVNPPDETLAFAARVVRGLPAPDWRTEADILERFGVTHLVCRNSGGSASYAKVEAARRLGLPVIMIERPAPPPDPVAATVETVMAWLAA